MHANIVEFEVSGENALFSDPLTRVGGEKCTYQVPTYEALKGVLHSIYWKPTIIWIVDAVRVMNQIQTETKGIRPLSYTGGNDLSYYTYLKSCRYRVRAHFEWNMNRPELAGDRDENKHHNIARRMVERGGRRDIFLGCRECQAYVTPCCLDDGTPCGFGDGPGFYDVTTELAFGLMYHGITYADEAYNNETKGRMTIRFWQPVMKNGVIDFVRPEECTVNKYLRETDIKPFGTELGNFQNAEA